MFYFTVKKVTLETMAKTNYEDSPMKINFLRYDSLALFLQYANITAKSNILIIEKCKGMILAGVSQRLNNEGLITYAFLDEIKKPLNQLLCFNQLNLCKGENNNIFLVEFENLFRNKELENSFTQ